MSEVVFRSVDVYGDAAAVCRVMATWESDPLEPEELPKLWGPGAEGITVDLRELAEVDGEVVGYGSTRQPTFMSDGFMIDVVVLPEFRGRGIGGVLVDRGEDFMFSKGLRRAHTRSREGDDAASKFLMDRGYAERMRMFESVVDLKVVNLEGYEVNRERVERGGFVTRRWDSVLESEGAEAWERLSEMFLEIDDDEPGTQEFGGADRAFFERDFVQKTGRRDDFTWIVEKDGEWVAMHSILAMGDGADVDGNVNYTGVRRAWRGHGLAKWLKYVGLARAKEVGWRSVLTHNDTRNLAMLAINEQFGFVRQPGLIFWRKELEV